jgi:hypothetical protein
MRNLGPQFAPLFTVQVSKHQLIKARPCRQAGSHSQIGVNSATLCGRIIVSARLVVRDRGLSPCTVAITGLWWVTVFLDVTPCSLVDRYQCYEGTFCLHLQCRKVSELLCDVTPCSLIDRYRCFGGSSVSIFSIELKRTFEMWQCVFLYRYRCFAGTRCLHVQDRRLRKLYWDVTLCMLDRYRCFGGAFCLYLQGWR